MCKSKVLIYKSGFTILSENSLVTKLVILWTLFFSIYLFLSVIGNKMNTLCF